MQEEVVVRDPKQQSELTLTKEQLYTAFTEKLQKFSESQFNTKLKNLKVAIEATSEVLELEAGESKRCVFIQDTELKTSEGVFPAVKLLGENKKMYIAGHAVIVNSLQGVPPFTPIEIISKGKAEGKRYYDYTVNILQPVM